MSKGEGRLALMNKFRQEIDDEIEINTKAHNQVRSEMKDFRSQIADEEAEEDPYAECFPKYGDDDFQASVKDNLSKRPPGQQRKPGGTRGKKAAPPKK